MDGTLHTLLRTKNISPRNLIDVNLNETGQGRALQKEVDGSEIVWGPSPSRERKGVLNEGLAALWSLLLL